MAQGYFFTKKADEPVVFDYFFRTCPFQGGFVVFCGLPLLQEALEQLRFETEDLAFLEKQGFKKDFLDYLKNFRFQGTLFSAREGEVVFPLEPVVRVEGRLLECQLVETLLLNILNFSSLIATKTARMVQAAKGRRIVDFGLRRAQGPAGILASRSAIIGGAQATSNVEAARLFDLPVAGTQAHSWVQSFSSELEAFRKYAELYPDGCVLLIDTYDTLHSGLPNAVQVARELKAKGKKLLGVRLDSGDLAYLSRRVRETLDREGFPEVKIIVSNQLDEYLVQSLLNQQAPINAFGIGTRLVTGGTDPALDGVYKLSQAGERTLIKVSDNPTKTTLPGRKKTIRYLDQEGSFYADGILLEEEKNVEIIHHPWLSVHFTKVRSYFSERLLYKIMENGRSLVKNTTHEAAAFAKERLAKLAPEHKRFENPHIYKVGLSGLLRDLRDQLLKNFRRTIGAPEEIS